MLKLRFFLLCLFSLFVNSYSTDIISITKNESWKYLYVNYPMLAYPDSNYWAINVDSLAAKNDTTLFWVTGRIRSVGSSKDSILLKCSFKHCSGADTVIRISGPNQLDIFFNHEQIKDTMVGSYDAGNCHGAQCQIQTMTDSATILWQNSSHIYFAYKIQSCCLGNYSNESKSYLSGLGLLADQQGSYDYMGPGSISHDFVLLQFNGDSIPVSLIEQQAPVIYPLRGPRSTGSRTIEVRKSSAGFFINLRLPAGNISPLSIAIYSLTGQKVAIFSDIKNNSVFWKTSEGNFAKGTYLVQAKLVDGTIFDKRILFSR